MESGVYLYFIRENGVELLSAGRIIRHWLPFKSFFRKPFLLNA
jgi:hypothetical protein